MIQAANRKKCPTIQEIHNNISCKFSVEDMVTSTLFGTFAYLPQSDSIRILDHILKLGLNSNHKAKWSGVNIQLWPRICSIEPDVVVDFTESGTTDSNPFKVVIEVKWDSSSSDSPTEHQLTRQWNALSPEEQKSTQHIYLTKYRDPLKVESKDKEKAKLIDKIPHKHLIKFIAWSDVCYSLKYPPKDLGEQSLSFCKDLAHFLGRENIHSFVGFSEIKELTALGALPENVFLNPWFSSFPQSIPVTPSVIFFQGTKS